jgi:hypothetical protein
MRNEPTTPVHSSHANSPDEARSSPPEELPLFLPDEPLAGLDTEDVLGHREYAEALARAVLGAKPPFTIGLFGEWGVGKTTIAKGYLPAELERFSPGSSGGLVYFDVWKYQDDALRRQLLREVASSLQRHKALERYDVDRELEDLEIDVSDSRFSLQLSRTHFLAAALRFLLYWAGAYVAVQVLRPVNLGSLIAPSAAIAAVLVLLRELGTSLLPAETRTTRKQVSAADQFEIKFQRLMNSVNAKIPRIVIVLDNIDRCEAKVAVEMLDTIKTFLEPVAKRSPIFVVPCDIEAIRRHVASVRREAVIVDGREEAGEYLRKFFNAAVTIQPLLDLDLRSLVKASLSRIALSRQGTSADQDGIVDVVVRAFRKNPRRAKQFLNNVVLKHLMVVEREKGGNLPAGVSAHLALIAKVTVLEEEWPDALRLVQEDPRGLEQMTALAIDLPIRASSRAAEVMKHHPDLHGFLKATRTISGEGASAIARLKAPPAEIGLSRYAQFRSVVADGDADEMNQILNNATEGPSEYVAAFSDLITELMRNRQISGAVNAIAAGSSVNALQTTEVANSVAEALLDRELQKNLHVFAPKRLLHLLVLADSDAAPRSVTEITRVASRQDMAAQLTAAGAAAWVKDAAEGVAEIAHQLPAAQLNEAKEMARLAIQQAKVIVLVGLSSVPDSAEKLIPEDALAETLHTGLGSVEIRDSKLVLDGPALVWARCRTWVGPDTVGAFAASMTAALSGISNAPSDPSALVPYLELAFASRDALRRCPFEPAAELGAQLGSHYALFQAETRPALFATLVALGKGAVGTLEAVTGQIGADQIEILKTVLADRESIRLMPDNIGQSLAVAARSRAASLAGTELQAILELIADSGDKFGWATVADTYADSAKRLEVAAVEQAIASRQELLDGSGVQEAAAAAFLERTGPGYSSYLPAFDALRPLQAYLSANQSVELSANLATVIESGDPAGRTGILERLGSQPETGPLGKPGAEALWDRLATFAGPRPGDPGVSEVLKWLVTTRGTVPRERVEELAGTIERTAQARTSADRDVGAAILAELTVTAAARQLRIPVLIEWSRREIGVTRHSIWRSAIRMAGPDRRPRPAKAVMNELKSAEGGDIAAGAELIANWAEVAAR